MVAVDDKLVRRRKRAVSRAAARCSGRHEPAGSFCRRCSNLDTTAVVTCNTTIQTWGVTQRYVYSPYGSLTILNGDFSVPPSGTQPVSDYLYQGMTLDQVTGLYYARNRNYSPSLGVWVSQDPLGYVNGADTYQMEMSGPVDLVDPFGLATEIQYKLLAHAIYRYGQHVYMLPGFVTIGGKTYCMLEKYHKKYMATREYRFRITSGGPGSTGGDLERAGEVLGGVGGVMIVGGGSPAPQ